MKIHIYIFIWCMYFCESHSSQNKYIPGISSIWPGRLLWFVDLRDIECFQLGHHALLVELLWKVAHMLQCMKVPQTNHTFFCNWHLILGSSGWFTPFTIEMEKLKFVFTSLFYFFPLPGQLKVASFSAHTLHLPRLASSLMCELSSASSPALLLWHPVQGIHSPSPFPQPPAPPVSPAESSRRLPSRFGPHLFLHSLRSYRTWSLRLFLITVFPWK